MNKNGFVSYFILSIMSSIILSFLICIEVVKLLSANVDLALKNTEMVFKLENEFFKKLKTIDQKKKESSAEIKVQDKKLSAKVLNLDGKLFVSDVTFE